MKLLSIMILCTTLGCAHVVTTSKGQHVAVFGKTEVTNECDGTKCETTVEGHGLTENAVAAVSELLKAIISVPGAIVRGAGQALP